jgi:hypothetical protein
MFFNEDGDLAHEFYEEVKSKKKKRSKMKKVDPSLLRPQVKDELVFHMKTGRHQLFFLFYSFAGPSQFAGSKDSPRSAHHPV